jgi:hypothetical protein
MYTVPCQNDHHICYDDIKRHISSELSHKSIPSCPLCLKTFYYFTVVDILHLFGSGPELDRFSNAAILLARSPHLFPCPTPDCTQYISIPDRPRQGNGVRCPSCTVDFCSFCRERNHYGISCELVPSATAEWLDRSKACGDAVALRRRRDELRLDEEWKEAHCRLCPHCLRPVERIWGCTAMLCGMDADGGGNKQAG